MNATSTKPRQSRKQPQAVHGVARWIGGTPTQERLDDGDAILSIVAEGKEPSLFFVTTNKDVTGKRIGFRLVKIDTLDKAETYDICTTAADWTCDCKDATYCERLGGCKHGKGLRAALKSVNLL